MSCADCGTRLGELCRDRTGDVLCFRCYQRRPDFDTVPSGEVVSFYAFGRAVSRERGRS
jgi:hypothetical protein